MSIARNNRYQEGSIDRVTRAKGPDMWVYRWRELNDQGVRVQHKKTIGTVEEYPNKSDVKREVENLRAEINAREERAGKMTVAGAWGHYQLHELHDPQVGRSTTTINRYLCIFKVNILPHWKDVPLDEVKAVRVEKWLRSLPMANASKSKIRNCLSALFSHCIRHELFEKLNPISSVRQSSLRQKDPEILTLDEMRRLIPLIKSEAVRLMVAVAATTALRRSEICGLKWKDLNFETKWMSLERGIVHNVETKLKTKASRKGVPMMDDLSDLLQDWKTKTAYSGDDDWVFASPHRKGKMPLNPVPAMDYWIKPAAKEAGISKHFNWHNFRHSVGSLLGQSGENIKVVQEILRHANSRITQDIYMQADQTAKREALKRFSGLRLVS
jgi:integrase